MLIAGFESAHDPFGRRTAEAGAARRALDASSCHLALLRVHAEWAAAADDAERRRVVDARGVNGAKLRDISSVAARLLDSIGEPHGRRAAVVITAADAKGGGSGGGGVSDAALAKACLLTGGAALVTRASGGAGRPIELLWKSHKAELILRPHAATVLGSSAVRVEADQLCVTLGAMRSPAGLVAHDVTLVTPLAVLLFGPRLAGLPEAVRAGAGFVRAGAEPPPGDAAAAASAAAVPAASAAGGGAFTHSSECALGEEASVAIELAGAMVTIPTADARLLAALRMHLDVAVASEGARGAPTNELAWRASLSRVVGELMRPMDVPWAGLPEGWRCEADAAGAPLFRSLLDPTHMSRQKPTVSAARFAASAAAAKGSLQRANEEHEAKRRERAAARAKEAEAAALAAAARQETREEEEARARAKSEEAAADKAAEAAQLRAVTMARAAAAEKAEASARRSAGVAGSLYGGVAKLLSELELTDRYAGAFAAAGYDNAALLRIAEGIDEGKADGTGEGLAALEKMIEAVGLRGGSAVKVRKRLTEPPKQGGARGGSGSGGGKGGGEGGGGEGGGRGGGGGGGARGRATGAKGGRSARAR